MTNDSCDNRNGDNRNGDNNVPIARIDVQQIQAFLNAHPHWREVGGKLHREFRFKSFVEAFGFMTQSALIAERADHHPEWFNVYNRVVVELVTHDAHGISQRDIDLARAMESIAGSMVQTASA